MEAKIISYRRSVRSQRTNQMLLRIKGVDTKEEANKLVGKKVVWLTSSGKKFVGKVSAPHGGNGVLRARFRRGLPGQAINTVVKIE